MPSVYELHLRSASLRAPVAPPSHTAADPVRPGEHSGERRIRLLRAVLGEQRARVKPPGE
jgi:hypothetical protein